MLIKLSSYSSKLEDSNFSLVLLKSFYIYFQITVKWHNTNSNSLSQDFKDASGQSNSLWNKWSGMKMK